MGKHARVKQKVSESGVRKAFLFITAQEKARECVPHFQGHFSKKPLKIDVFLKQVPAFPRHPKTSAKPSFSIHGELYQRAKDAPLIF